MHCPNCGQQTSSELKFCRACGRKLDHVARAVNEHMGGEVTTEKDNEKAPANPFFNSVYIGIALMFIGIVIGVAGQGMWGAKTASVITALLGMLIMASRFLPVAARYDRDFLRAINKPGAEAVGQKEMRDSETELKLPAGDDFQPAARPVSVTEGTTRNLDEDKIKVLK